jgi:hypothetical protein
VRGALAWLVALIASCAPDYAHTAFRCGGGHDCPPDQTCLDGRCRRGAPAGTVVCSGDGQHSCALGEQCCLYQDGPGCIAAGDVCPEPSALCDGREDCQGNDRCCADGTIAFCDAACDRYACRDDGDCPSTVPRCCFDELPLWGHCVASGC